jgi:hypothetical protein
MEENTDMEDKLRLEYASDEVWEEIDVDSLDEGNYICIYIYNIRIFVKTHIHIYILCICCILV